VGKKPAKPLLLEGLTRLEYRGYDSAGLALYDSNKNDFFIKRCVGAVKTLVDASQNDGKTETQGIAHTRWATHGAPNETNAHPHRTGRLVLVHNGIIENHAQLKTQLMQRGIAFLSQTDTEVFARLIEVKREEEASKHKGDFEELPLDTRRQIVLRALSNAMKDVEGHYAVLFMVLGLEGHIFGVQNGAPIAITQAQDGVYVASDLQPLLAHSREVSFAPMGTIFELTSDEILYYRRQDLSTIKPEFEAIEWNAEQVAKDGYEHYMLKEIYQQPMVVADTLSGRLPETPQAPFMWDRPAEHALLWKDVKKVYLIGCGTAYHAAMVAKYYFERWAHLPVEVDIASEFRYRNPVFEKGCILGVISQSGETADTLAALRLANASNIPTFSVCNVPASTIMRESRFRYPTKAGPEIGVASTKAFTAQLTVLCALAQDAARIREFPRGLALELARVPHDMNRVLAHAEEYMKIGASLKDCKTIFFLGRGLMYPIALEGALKLKEITYRHAEGYGAGELKHGPIALVDKDLAAIVLSPTDELLPKTLSNLEEIKSRGARIIGIGEDNNSSFANLCDQYVGLPYTSWGTAPLIYVLPLQLISYGLARAMGREIDKPRNLAKSVTVE
jgi:glucosamine--fructose-6-phosphate aminotransferase (isomerizing)